MSFSDLLPSGPGAPPAPAVPACEAVWEFLGIEAPCGQAAVGRFRRACVHEHVREGWMCEGHADTPENGLCLTCWQLPGDLSHECPITIAQVTP